MTDTTQGQDAPSQNDAALFRDAIDAPTLDKFENPPLPEVKPDVKPPEGQKTTDGPKPGEQQQQQQPEAPIPPGRLREESERARRAEREAADLRARLAAYEVQPRQQQQQPQKLDVFDNPSGFVKQEIEPLLSQFRNELQQTREAISADNAVRNYGEEKVTAARQALEQGMARHDPHAWATYNRAMQSHDPYGVIVRSHVERETLSQIGGDLETYKQRILQEALKDPEFHKQVIAAAKGQAAAGGRQINQPAVIAQSKVPTIPSLSDIGAAGADEQIIEPSDDALFRAAVSAKRRS